MCIYLKKFWYQILKIYTYLKKFGIKFWKYILISRNVSLSKFENIYLFEEIWNQILKIYTYFKKCFVIKIWKYILIWRNILVGARFFATVQTGPGFHQASYTTGTGSFPGVKRPGRDVDHPPTSSAEVKERLELYFSSPSAPSWPVLG